MNQITKTKDLVGKVVYKVYEYNDKLYIGFKDHSFVVLQNGNYNTHYGIHPSQSVAFSMDFHGEALYKVGAITHEEWRQAVIEKQLKEAAHREQMRKAIVETQRERELAELKRLKEKYENA